VIFLPAALAGVTTLYPQRIWSYRAEVSKHSPHQTLAGRIGHQNLLLCMWWKIRHWGVGFPDRAEWGKIRYVGWNPAADCLRSNPLPRGDQHRLSNAFRTHSPFRCIHWM